MKLLTNYEKDLYRSKTTPLLIELSKKDLDLMSKEDTSGLNISSYFAKEIYDNDMKDETETNVIYINADQADGSDHIYLLEEFLERITDQVKDIKNLNIVKEGISKGLSFATGGLLDSVFGGFVDQGVDLVIDNISNSVTDLLIDTTLEYVDISDKILGTAEEKIHEVINNISINFLDEIQKNEICLSSDAKKAISELSKEFKKELTAAESFRLILQLMLSVAIDNPKIIFIKNPHKLDKNSLAILSMLFSFSKDAKDQEKHTGLSVVYAYEDEAFQPYSEVKEEFKQSKILLDEQRRFTQRYAMLERPTSDIPHIAVKSTMFVGRQEELENLNARYHYSKEHKYVATLETISGDPGVGKTKLIKKHLEEIRPKEGERAKQIQLSLLNQVGHTSTNTGIGSLIDSLIKEAHRLENAKKWNEKVIDTIVEKAQDGVLGFIKSALGVDALIDVGTAFIDRVETDSQIKQIQHNTMGEQDNKPQDKKQEQFTNLNRAIKKLQELSDDTIPIVLFIDDLQWIDEDSAEYIIEHFTKAFNVHMVASIRPSDASTTLKQAYENKELNPYKIALLKEVGIKIYDNEHEIEIDSDINTQKIESNTIHLLGLDSITLTSLISQVIKPIDNDDTKQKILATTIINELNNDKTKDEVNTLFAVETINMLCDRRFYFTKDQDGVELPKVEPQLIVTDGKLKFNNNISNDKIEAVIQDTFENLKRDYESSFKHNNAKGKDLVPTFNLMAYAVLEERLHILKIYFGEGEHGHGNAAVNTLLFSSLLGTPFNSTIVKNILDALATTDEELLQPLKEYILEGNEEVSLNETHYEIIEEVYEILSRYQAFNSAYEHRHSLLNIFLDKQLEYQLDEVFKEDNKDIKDSKNSLYTLVLEKIKEEEEQQDFYKKHESSLNSKQYENMIFYKQAQLNVLEKAYLQDADIWLRDYILSLSELAILYSGQYEFSEAIEQQEKILSITEKYYQPYNPESRSLYVASLNNLAQSYFKQNRLDKAIELSRKALDLLEEAYPWNPKYFGGIYSTSLGNHAGYLKALGKVHEALALDEKALLIIEKLYHDDPEQWVHHYVTTLGSLGNSHYEQKNFHMTIVLEKKNLSILEKLFQEDSERWAEKYTLSLNNIAAPYKELNRLDKAIALEKKVLEIREKLYDENPEYWAEEYIISLKSLGISYDQKNRFDEAIALFKKALEIVEELYEGNAEFWGVDYSIILNRLAITYQNDDRLDESIAFEEKALLIGEKLYEGNPEGWRKYYVTLLLNLARSYNSINRVPDSIVLYEKALPIVEKLYLENPESEDMADQYIESLNFLALEYDEQNRESEAIVLYDQLVFLLKKLYHDDQELWVFRYATIIVTIAMKYAVSNRVPKAIELLEQSVPIVENLYHEDEEHHEHWVNFYPSSLNVLTMLKETSNDLIEEEIALHEKATSLNNITNSYQEQNRVTEEAIVVEQKEVKINEALYLENPNDSIDDYVRKLINNAILYSKNNQIEEAIVLEEKALKILETLYQENPSVWIEDYTTILSNLSASYKNNHQIEEAIVLEQKELEITKTLYLENPSIWAEDYAAILSDLSASYKNNEQIEEAIVLKQMALKITEDFYKVNQSDWAEEYTTSLTNLANLYRDNEQLVEAVALEERAFEIIEKPEQTEPVESSLEKHSQGNPECIEEDYINYLESILEKAEAEEQNLENLEKLFQQNPEKWAPQYIFSLTNLEKSYREQKRYTEAIHIQDKYIGILEKLYSGDSEKWVELYFASLYHLAFIYNEQNRFAEAIEPLKKALEILEKLFQQNPQRWAEDYIEYLERLSLLYHQTSNISKSMELFLEAELLKENFHQENMGHKSEEFGSFSTDLAYSDSDENDV